MCVGNKGNKKGGEDFKFDFGGKQEQGKKRLLYAFI
jgi:hypothetical protein